MRDSAIVNDATPIVQGGLVPAYRNVGHTLYMFYDEFEQYLPVRDVPPGIYDCRSIKEMVIRYEEHKGLEWRYRLYDKSGDFMGNNR